MTNATLTTLPEALAALLDRLGALLHDDGFAAASATGNAPYAIFERGNLISVLDAPDDEPVPASRLMELQEHPDHPGHERLVQTWAVGPRGYLLLIRAAEARARGSGMSTAAATDSTIEVPGDDAGGEDASVLPNELGPNHLVDGQVPEWIEDADVLQILGLSRSQLYRLLKLAAGRKLPGSPVSLSVRGDKKRSSRRWNPVKLEEWFRAVSRLESRTSPEAKPRRPSSPRSRGKTVSNGVVDWTLKTPELIK